MTAFKYTINGQDYNVQIGEIIDNVAEVTVNGEGFSVSLPEEEKAPAPAPKAAPKAAEATPAAATTASADAFKLVAPLPGTVVDIKVNVGDEVSAGDTLVVLEAMKMANNLESEKTGKVSAICVKLGESVMEDAVLVIVD